MKDRIVKPDATVYKVVEVKSNLTPKYTMYKISSSLKKSKHRFCSCVVYDIDCAVSYEIGKTTKPKFGKLFAFESLDAAKYFKSRKRIILECKAKNVRPKSNMCIVFDYQIFEDFWSKYEYRTGTTPSGTVTCDSITPIRIVK